MWFNYYNQLPDRSQNMVDISKNEQKNNRIHSRYLTLLPPNIFEIKSVIYWQDFLSCVFLGWSAFILTGVVARFSLQFCFLWVVAILTLYRCLGFVHEIIHQQNNKKYLKGFVSLWHLFFGIPFFFPSPFYQCHLEHHKKHKTIEDPQYPFLRGNRWAIIRLVILNPLLYPLLFAFRFLVLSPLSIFNQRLRHFLDTQLSSIAEPGYIAKFNHQQRQLLYKVEVAIFIFWGVILLLLISKIIPSYYLAAWYFLLTSMWSLNFFRVLGEHRLDQLSETPLTPEEQLLDSYTYSQGFLLPLLYFVGLRYHALHHLYPNIPYHNLSQAHQSLKKHLPEDSLYHTTDKLGHWNSVKHLWNNL